MQEVVSRVIENHSQLSPKGAAFLQNSWKCDGGGALQAASRAQCCFKNTFLERVQDLGGAWQVFVNFGVSALACVSVCLQSFVRVSGVSRSV